MPRVVQPYGAPKVQTAALPGVRKQAHETFESRGGQVAEAQAALGGSIARIGAIGYSQIQQAERDRADDIANLKTAEAFNGVEHKLLYDEQTGILNKTGTDPHELRDQYVGDFDRQASEIGANLKTDKQRLFFEQQRIARRSSISDRIDTHAVQTLDKYQHDQFNATMASSVNAAIAAGMDDPGRVRTEFNFQDAQLQLHAQQFGLSPEAREQARVEMQAKVHTGIIDQLLARGQDKKAAAYFDETKDTIAKADPQAIASIQAKLAEGTTLGEAQRSADGILTTSHTIEEARAAAKAIEDPKVRQTTLELVEHEYSLKDKAERDAHEQLTLKGLNIIERSGRWTSIPPNEWAQYTVGERASIKEYLRAKADGGVKTDPTTYAALINMASSDDPNVRKAFQALNPVTLLDKLSPSDFQEVTRLQASSRKGDQADVERLTNDAKNQNAMVDEALVSMALPSNPIEPGKKDHDPVQFARVNQFRRAVREAVARQVTQNGNKPATDEQVQTIVDLLRTRTGTGSRVIKSGRLWDTTGDAYAFEEAQAQADTVADIPAGERRRIEDALRANKVPVSDGAVLKYFNQLLTLVRKDR